MSRADARQLGRNLLINVASFGSNVAVGLWLVPYLVDHLGVAAYGLVPLAMVFTEYVGLLTQSFNAAVSRFLTVQLRGDERAGAGTVFNSSLALIVGLSAVQGIAAVLVLFHLDTLIEVPDGLLRDTVWLFGTTFAGFILSMIGGVFGVSMYSHNRLDLMRGIDIGRLAVKISTIVLLFALQGPSLLFVGLGNLMGGLCTLVLSIVQWRRLTPELSIRPKEVALDKMKPIAGMAAWVIINTVGYLLFLRIDIYVVNRFIGPVAGGEYAAVLQWSQLVRTAAGVLSGVLTPLGMIYFAKGELQKLSRMMTLAVKVMSLGLAPVIAVLCAFSSDILAVWLGEGFRSLGSLMSLQLCALVVNLGVLPLFSINVATNRVKLPAIVTVVLGALNFLLAVWFVQQLRWGYHGVALAGIMVLTAKNALFTPWYAAHVLQLKQMTFFRPLMSGLIAFAAIFGCAFAARTLVPDNSLLAVGLLAGALLLTSLPPLIWWGLSREERAQVADMAPQRLQRRFRWLLMVSS